MANYIHIGNVKTEGITFADDTRQVSAATNLIDIKRVNGTYSISKNDIEDFRMIKINSPLNIQSYAFLPADNDVPVGTNVYVSSDGPGSVVVGAVPPASVKTPQSTIIERKYGRVLAIKTAADVWEIDGQLKEEAQFIFKFNVGAHYLALNSSNYYDFLDSDLVLSSIYVYDGRSVGTFDAPDSSISIPEMINYQNWVAFDGSSISMSFGTAPATDKYVRLRCLDEELVTMLPKFTQASGYVDQYDLGEWVKIESSTTPEYWYRTPRWNFTAPYLLRSTPGCRIRFEMDISETASEDGIIGTVGISKLEYRYSRFNETVNVPFQTEYLVNGFGTVTDATGLTAFGNIQTRPDYQIPMDGSYGVYMMIESPTYGTTVYSNDMLQSLTLGSYFNVQEFASYSNTLRITLTEPVPTGEDSLLRIKMATDATGVIQSISTVIPAVATNTTPVLVNESYLNVMTNLSYQNISSTGGYYEFPDYEWMNAYGQISIGLDGPEVKIVTDNEFFNTYDISIEPTFSTRDNWEFFDTVIDASANGKSFSISPLDIEYIIDAGGPEINPADYQFSWNTTPEILASGFRNCNTQVNTFYQYNANGTETAEADQPAWFFQFNLQSMLNKRFSATITIRDNSTLAVIGKCIVKFRLHEAGQYELGHFRVQAGGTTGSYFEGDPATLAINKNGKMFVEQYGGNEVTSTSVFTTTHLAENVNPPYIAVPGLSFTVTKRVTDLNTYNVILFETIVGLTSFKDADLLIPLDTVRPLDTGIEYIVQVYSTKYGDENFSYVLQLEPAA